MIHDYVQKHPSLGNSQDSMLTPVQELRTGHIVQVQSIAMCMAIWIMSQLQILPPLGVKLHWAGNSFMHSSILSSFIPNFVTSCVPFQPNFCKMFLQEKGLGWWMPYDRPSPAWACCHGSGQLWDIYLMTRFLYFLWLLWSVLLEVLYSLAGKSLSIFSWEVAERSCCRYKINSNNDAWGGKSSLAHTCSMKFVVPCNTQIQMMAMRH